MLSRLKGTYTLDFQGYLTTNSDLITYIYLNDQLAYDSSCSSKKTDTNKPQGLVSHLTLSDPCPLESVGIIRIEIWKKEKWSPKTKHNEGTFRFEKLLNNRITHTFQGENDPHQIRLGMYLRLDKVSYELSGFHIPEPDPILRISKIELMSYPMANNLKYDHAMFDNAVPLGHQGPIHLSDFFRIYNREICEQAQEQLRTQSPTDNQTITVRLLKIHTIIPGRQLVLKVPGTIHCYLVYYQSYLHTFHYAEPSIAPETNFSLDSDSKSSDSVVTGVSNQFLSSGQSPVAKTKNLIDL